MDGFKARPRRTSYSDGVAPQRSSVGSNVSTNNANKPSISATPYPPISASTPSTVEPPSKVGVSKAELDESLRSIDTPDISKKGRRNRKPKSKKRRIIKWIIIVIVLCILGVGGWIAYKVLHAGSTIFKGNIFSAIIAPDKPLKADSLGNTNILLLGTSESDPNHPAAQLTDSMMVISVNQKSKQVFLMSIPRDLWVTYDKPCSVGYSGKINATYECSLGTSLGGLAATQNDELTAETNTASKVSEVTGVGIQYVVHMNLAVIQKVVDAVGGIDITIDSPDPRGILDRNFDWRCNYKCYLVKYPNGPAHLTGTNAMWLAQARNDAGGYGLPRSNFDREANQRKIAIATKDKATSVGFLANPINVVNLIDALGTNLHTTIDSTEIKSFVDLIKAVPSNNITSIDLQDDGPSILTTGTGPDGSSIVEPTAGLEDYVAIQNFTQQLLSGQAPIIAEHAAVDVLNGSGTSGAGQTEATALQSDGYTIGTVATAPTGTYPQYSIYDLSKGAKPKTLAGLEAKLGVKTASTKLPAGITSTASFVVIVGPSKTTSNSDTGSTQQ